MWKLSFSLTGEVIVLVAIADTDKVGLFIELLAFVPGFVPRGFDAAGKVTLTLVVREGLRASFWQIGI